MGCESCYTCEDLVDQQVNLDCDPLSGVVPEVIFFRCGSLPTDPSDGTEIQNLITAGDAVLYKQLKVLVNAPAEITTASQVAGQTDGVSSYDRTASYIDGNVNPINVDAYNEMNSSNGKRFGGMLLYYCESEQVKFIQSTTQLVGGDNDVENEQSKFEGELRWRSKADPTLHPAPAGIFGQ